MSKLYKRLIAIVVVLAVVAGITTWVFWPDHRSVPKDVDLSPHLSTFTYTFGTSYDVYLSESKSQTKCL